MIDAHQHIWQIGRNGCTWPAPTDSLLYRDFSMGDFRREMQPHGVASSVLVQSQESEADTDWLLEIAARDGGVVAVVGWTNLAAADAAERIASLAARSKLVGLRPMVQDRRTDWYDDPALDAALTAMSDRSLRLDALVRGRHLPALRRVSARYPDLGIVIDHAAKPSIGGRDGFAAWRDAIAPLAERTNVACKLSGLFNECGGPLVEAIEPYIAAILDMFGPDRVMWGSDWPVLNAVSTYGAWLSFALRLVPQDAQKSVFGGTATRFYGIAREVAQ